MHPVYKFTILPIFSFASKIQYPVSDLKKKIKSTIKLQNK